MSDVFSAIVEASGTLSYETTYIPMRNFPVMFQLGNSDDLWLGSTSFSIPMALCDTLLTNYPVFQGIVHTHTNTFGLDSTYTLSGDISSALTATFKGTSPNYAQVFHFVLIKDLEHNYPNVINHPLKVAEIHWNWMKQFTLP